MVNEVIVANLTSFDFQDTEHEARHCHSVEVQLLLEQPVLLCLEFN